MMRMVDSDSVRRVEANICDTFNSVDPETGQVLIAPRGPDPVLYGVRGETRVAVLSALSEIVVGEPFERWVIFRSNQGTDTHLARVYRISDLKPRYPSIVTGMIEGGFKTIEGGHVIFTIDDGSGSLDCAAYEPSGGFRGVVMKLRKGDEVRVAGGVRETDLGLTLNLERLEVLSLATSQRLVNPHCPECGGSTESMGKGQGLRCKRCGYRGADLVKRSMEVPREIKLGLYLPPPRAERHLTKPVKRYGKEQKRAPSRIEAPWHKE
jgi:tRNA(Ile2)-agmatinylcytidine synthase